MLFYLAGFETTASLLSFASYLLACNPEEQEKLREEVEEMFEKCDVRFYFTAFVQQRTHSG